jgi:4-hydroxythreonine-4-phosphate dehydrogenase
MKPTIGIILGDPCGVGPEIVAKLLADQDVLSRARIVLVADRSVFRAGQLVAGVDVATEEVDGAGCVGQGTGKPLLLHVDAGPASGYPAGEATAAGGRYALATLKAALDLARDGAVDAVCYAPLNKHALQLAGSPFPDEILWIADELGHDGPLCDCTVLDGLWTARVTSHVPIADVSRHITQDRIIEVGRLIHATLLRAGIDRPRISVSALNPHAGDGGLIGREEIDVIVPAIERLRAEGLPVDGPFSPDTVFLKGKAKEIDAVVTMYHDQGQIAVKLMGFGRAITVIGGIDIPVTTPSQGTAFDIVGMGKAKPDGMRRAFSVACDMAEARMRSQAALPV